MKKLEKLKRDLPKKAKLNKFMSVNLKGGASGTDPKRRNSATDG